MFNDIGWFVRIAGYALAKEHDATTSVMSTGTINDTLSLGAFGQMLPVPTVGPAGKRLAYLRSTDVAPVPVQVDTDYESSHSGSDHRMRCEQSGPAKILFRLHRVVVVPSRLCTYTTVFHDDHRTRRGSRQVQRE